MKGAARNIFGTASLAEPCGYLASPISPFGIDQEHPCFARKVLLWWGPDYISIYNDAYVPIFLVITTQHVSKPVQQRRRCLVGSSPIGSGRKSGEDRRHLEARARRLLKGYLSANAPRKQRYYEVIAGAAAACQPGVSDPHLENAQLDQAAAEAALKVVKLREHQAIADNDQLAALITDAYATEAIAYRRASAAYTVDEEMQKLGTAAVHLLTIATSYMAAQSAETTPRDDFIG